MTQQDFEAIVLGLGGLGSAAAFRLARRLGGRVLGLEQFALGHGRGESHDHSRIIRLTYHTPEYVRLAQAACAAWGEVEHLSGRQLVHRTGELDLWPADSPWRMADYEAAMAACGVAFERLDAAEAMRRYPQFRLDASVQAHYQADGGLVAAAEATAAHRALARAHGAVLLGDTPVTGLRRAGGLWQVDTPAGRHAAPRLVLAAGPWTNRALAWLGHRLPLRVTREQVGFYPVGDAAAFAPGRFPVWMWMIPANYYGFPEFGAPGIKIAKDRFAPTDPDIAEDTPDAAHEAQVAAFVAGLLPQLTGPRLSGKTCVLTHTPDDDFVLDAVPGAPGCHVVVGAAHAYKFAAVIGDILADQALDGGTPHDIAAFRFDRPALAAEAAGQATPHGGGPGTCSNC